MKKILITLLLILPTLATCNDETFETFANRLNSWATDMYGIVVSSKNNETIIDLGKKNNLIPGVRFEVTRTGDELFHPITGLSLGKKILTLGEVEIKKVQDNYSFVLYNGTTKLIPGDTVSLITPIYTRFITKGLTDDEMKDVKYQIFKDKFFIEQDNTTYTINIIKNSESDETATASLLLGNRTIISVNIPLRSVVITTAESSVVKSQHDNSFISVAGGFAIDENVPNIALAEERAINIYSYTDRLNLVSAINEKFNNIINVELIDINGNGVDELLVSHLDKNFNPKSYIFEYAEGDFIKVGSDLPFLFRTYYMDGIKVPICQAFKDGSFIGPIYYLQYVDSIYKEGNEIDDSLGKRLYGFGKNLKGDIISFQKSGDISVEYASGKKDIIKGDFGNTTHNINYQTAVELIEAPTVDTPQYNETKTIAISVFQRIIEVAKGKYLLSGNAVKSKSAIKENNITSSSLGVYFFLNSTADAVWLRDKIPPALVETDVISNNDKQIFVTLKGGDKGLFKFAKSDVIIYEINIK